MLQNLARVTLGLLLSVSVGAVGCSNRGGSDSSGTESAPTPAVSSSDGGQGGADSSASSGEADDAGLLDGR